MGWISTAIVPTIIVGIITAGLIEKKDIYNKFCDGAINGLKIMYKMFPTLIGIFLAIGMLRNSGILDFLSQKINIFTKIINFPNEIIPLILIKPISGSGSMAIATDLMKKFGVDSQIGKLAGTIMSSSETTFYVIALYLSSIKIKSTKKIIFPALIANIITIIVAIIIIK